MSLPNSPTGNSASRPTWQEQLSGKPLDDHPLIPWEAEDEE